MFVKQIADKREQFVIYSTSHTKVEKEQKRITEIYDHHYLHLHKQNRCVSDT